MESEDKNKLALVTLMTVCEGMQETYTITHSFKAYKSRQLKCSVKLINKTFTAYGDDCFYYALKDAVKWIVFTFSKFKDEKEAWIKKDEEKQQFCLPSEFKIVKSI